MKPSDNDNRPNPDALLKVVQREEEKEKRGKLKVFLGMAAGVGKTYSMLSAAQELLARGIDAVIGLVETHGRSETEALLKGLPIIPRGKISYRNVELQEMNLDAILTRKPQIVLVDEAAHTNVPGSRHAKRYQDIFEIMDAGIDVYTTLNIQHLESMADTVREITSVKISETIPDSIIDIADELVLVDLAPDELIKRLKEGKVYGQESAGQAVQNFFQRGNLTALRELSLRMVAESVNRELHDYQQAHHISEIWKTSHRLMVAIYASPYSEFLIRWTRRMAASLNAPWYGAYVETDHPLSEKERQLLSKNFALAKELGGEIIQTVDKDAVTGLLRLARENHVTQLVVGKSHRSLWHNLMRGGSVTNRLLKECGSIDLYVVSGEFSGESTEAAKQFQKEPASVSYGRYLIAFMAPLLISIIGYIINPIVAYRAVGFLFLITISIMGLFVGRLAILIAAILSSLLWDFIFIPPSYTFAISGTEDYMMFGMFIITAIIIGHLTSRLRNNEKLMRLREAHTNALYQLTRKISSAESMNKVITLAVEHLDKIFDADVAVFVKRSDKVLKPYKGDSFMFDDKEKGVLEWATLHSRPDGIFSDMLMLDNKERSVAEWVALNSRPAGLFTDTLSSAKAFYLPLVASQGTVGVLGLYPREQKRSSPELMILAETFARQLAVGIEREQLNEIARKTLIVQESERLYKTILNSVSHELKTPLAAIEGSASALLDPIIAGNSDSVHELATAVQESSQRLNRLVKNLLDMTRLESGVIPLRREPVDVHDLVSTTLRHLSKELAEHPVSINIPNDMPMIPFDFLMMEQALGNILHNVAAHTPKGTPVKLSARIDGNKFILEMLDKGPGLPSQNPEIVFDKFWRSEPQKAGGTGLGLAIAKGWVEAHGGIIQARNHPNGGAWFIIRLPLEPQNDRRKE